MARRLAALVPFYEYDEAQLLPRRRCAGGRRGAPPRRVSCGLPRSIASASPNDRAAHRRGARTAISDLQFTDAYRVPFQFSRFVREHLKRGAFVQSSGGVTRHRSRRQRASTISPAPTASTCSATTSTRSASTRGVERVRELGPVLGAYHPVVADNVKRLREISGLDEVSFHMSGTEAVMQAVRLARYHTRRTHLVRFCGAYHGWWGDVQPGIGNPVPARETYTLNDMSETTLRVLRTRRDIACVLVNPLQALHPERERAGRFLAGRQRPRSAHFDRRPTPTWLQASCARSAPSAASC